MTEQIAQLKEKKLEIGEVCLLKLLQNFSAGVVKGQNTLTKKIFILHQTSYVDTERDDVNKDCNSTANQSIRAWLLQR